MRKLVVLGYFLMIGIVAYLTFNVISYIKAGGQEQFYTGETKENLSYTEAQKVIAHFDATESYYRKVIYGYKITPRLILWPIVEKVELSTEYYHY